MSWVDKAREKAEKILSTEDQLLKETYSPEFAELARKGGLYFSFGDIRHIINTSLTYSIFKRLHGTHAGIACFEDLIKRIRLYLIAELKLVLANEEPYKNSGGVDHNFIVDFLDLFKILDNLDEELKEIRKREGGYYG